MATPAAVLSIVVEANTGKAQTELKKFRDKLRGVDREKATAEVGIDDKGARAKLAALSKDMADFARKSAEAKVGVDKAEFEAQIKSARATLDAVDREQVTPEMNLRLAGLYSDVAKAEAALDVAARDREVKIDVDRSTLGKLTSIARGAERLSSSFEGVATAAGGAGGAQRVVTKESAKLGDVFNRSQLSIGQWTGVLAASLPVVFDLVGALGALTASLGAAVAGAGALGAGIAGSLTVGLGGIAAIAAPAISSLKDLMTAQESADKARVTGSAAASRASVASAQQILAAEQQLQNTQRAAEVAQESLTAAREEATRQLQDMRRAALGADESEESARIGLRRAQLELRRVNGDLSSSTLDVREAENDVALARNNLRDVTIDGSRAVKDYREAQRGGVREMPGVVAAQRSLDDANRSVADAVQNLAQQQREANAAAGAGATSMAALALAQKKAGPEAVKFAKSIKGLGREWRGLTREGKADFFGMMNDSLGRLNKRLPLFAESANKSMGALRRGFDQFLDRATGPEFTTFINVMTDTFAKSIGPVSRAFGNIAKVLQRIAVAVAPDIVRMAHDFEGMTEGWLDATDNANKLRDTVHGLVGHTRAWWDLLVQAKDLIVAVLVPGMGEGKNAIKEMTGQLKEWTDWANAHPKEIRDFMKEGLETTRQLAEVLIGFLPQLFEIAKATRPIARLLLGATKALNSIKIGNVSALTVLIGAFAATKFIRAMMAMRATLALMAGGAVARGARALLGITAANAAASAVPLGAGTSTTTATGRTIGSTGGKAAGGGFARAFGAAARVAMPIAAAYGIYESFTTSGGIIDTIKGKGTDAGAGMAEEMSSEFAEKVAPKMKHAMRQLNFGAMDQITEQTHRMIEAFDAAGIEIPDALRQMARAQDRQVANMKESFGDWKSSLMELKQMIFRSMGDIKDKTRETLKDINKIQGLSNERRMDMTERTYHAELQTIRKSLRLGLVEHRQANQEIQNITRHLLKDVYGVKDVQRLIVSDRVLAGAANRVGKQRGGSIPGAGSGDTVPAMLEPGEFVVNKKATKAARPMLEDLNRKVPRFQKGGVVQRLAKGGMAAMTARANKFEQAQFPYVWGGGHGSFGIQPVDCSGAVSDVLHVAGLLDAPMVSGALASWGKPGKGALTVYANPEHTFMSLAGKYFGTSSSNPGGGAGWMSDPGAGYRAGFAARTMDVGGMGAKIRLPRYKATASSATGTAAGLNATAIAAERAIKNAVSAGGAFGGGQALRDIKLGSIKGMARQMVGQMWGSGQWPPFAALEMAEAGWNPRAVNASSGAAGLAQALPPSKYPPGAWPYTGPKSALLQLQWMMGYIKDRYGNPANAWSFHQSHNWYKQGGMVAPYVGSFDKGGQVAQTGLGLLHKGEQVVPMQQGGIIGPTHWRWIVNEIKRMRDPHPIHHERQERRERRREEEQRERREERRNEERLQRETREETRARHRREERAERRQHARQERRQERELERLLIGQVKELQRDIKEHNRLYRQVRGREKVALQALASFVGSEIGAKGQEKRRLASAGSVARY